MKALVADDSAASRGLLTDALVEWGYEVVAASDGEEAWRILQQEGAPRLLLLDWVMPGLDGLEICRRIRGRREAPYTYVIMVTCQSDKGHLIQALEAGADDYLAKPFDVAELRVRVRAGQRILDLEAGLAAERDSLRESEHKYRHLFENLNDAAFVADAETGLILDTNRGAELLLGRSRAEIIGMHQSRLHPPGKKDYYRGAFERHVCQGRYADYDAEVIRADGRIVPVSIGAATLEIGGRGLILGLFRDITAHVRAQGEVAELKQQIEFILGATRTGLDIIDADYNIRYIDPEWGKVYGDPAGRKCYEYFMGRGEVCEGCGIQKALETKSVVVYEEILVREGNRPIQVMTIPFQDSEGEWLVAEVNVDITERKKAEARLIEERNRAQRAEQLLSDLIESAQDAMIITDARHVVITFNRKAEELFGYSKAEMLGQELSLLFPPPQWRHWEEAYLGTGRPGAGGMTLQGDAQRRDGLLFSVELSLSQTTVGEEALFTAIIRDVTEKVEREGQLKVIAEENNACALEHATKAKELEEALTQLKQAQAQLLQSEKMAAIGQLAAGVAHEINNPVGFINSNLNTLSGYHRDVAGLLDKYAALEAALGNGGGSAALVAEIQALKKKVDLEYVIPDFANIIKESLEGVARIKDIVAALKDFSRLDQAEVSSADINAGLESTLKIVWNELKYKTKVVRDFGELPLLRCHPRQLNQVFMNLLVNAAQAIEDKGEIRITTRPCDGVHPGVEVRIADTGRGIAPENLPRIFEPFFTTKPVGKGTGLGLHIAYSIIQKHGGAIEVASEVGRGTTFCIRLPLDGLESVREADDEQPQYIAD